MHPATVREFLTASVAELEARLAGSEAPVASIALDLDTPELIIAFDHTEHEMQVMASRSRLLGPDGRPLIQQHRVPVLGGTSRVHRRHLRMNLARFDLVPPTAELLDESRQPVPGGHWPTSWLGRGIVQQHPVYQRPFFCRPGLREYHEHQQHEDEPWARWREVLPLHLIVTGLVEDMHERFHGAA